MKLPDVVATVPDLRARVAAWRRAGERVALVPTMGALHEGHLALVRRGLQEAERVVVSIFVNPKQFGPQEDLAKYPRTAERDRTLLAGLADLVFAPTPQVMYPGGFTTAVSVAGPSAGFEGAARPGHFDGVATVVSKLFIQAAPDIAVFGEKDWQQLQVVRRMVRDLDLPLAVIGHPTVRDEHGLALSSRNVYLSPEELATARRLNGILAEIAAKLAGDGWATTLEAGRAAVLSAGLGPVDYLAAVDAETMAPLAAPAAGRSARLVAAVHLGPIRLLDNMPVPAADTAVPRSRNRA
jgi:pantoate--beta-alanine ligase